MDILFIILKTGGYLASLSIVALVPALFIAAILTRLPMWVAALGMALVAFIAGYPTGMLEGISQESRAWEMAMEKEREKQDENLELAQFVINESAAAHRVRERNIRTGNTTSITALNEKIVELRLEVSNMEETKFDPVYCINSKVPDSIVKRLREIR